MSISGIVTSHKSATLDNKSFDTDDITIVALLRSVVLTLLLFARSSAAQPLNVGPFGFQYGMTMDEVVQLVGRNAIERRGEHSLTLKTAPKPHPAFESYEVCISPRKGLLKIEAIGKTVPTNRFGSEVQDEFLRIRTALEHVYGTAEIYDHLKEKSIWSERADWMMSLLKKERVLTAFWMSPKSLNHISAIELEAHSLTISAGYLLLGYEFDGWDEFADSIRAKQDQVF